jgi:Bacterial regulatory helix-turn-helix protein, lysR family
VAVFLAVAQRGSHHKAGEELRTDQPALSRSSGRLERLVGASLFVRSSRGLTLADLGRQGTDIAELMRLTGWKRTKLYGHLQKCAEADRAIRVSGGGGAGGPPGIGHRE